MPGVRNATYSSLSLLPWGQPIQATWSQGAFVSAYANRNLRPVEVLLLVRLRENLSGSGPGAGLRRRADRGVPGGAGACEFHNESSLVHDFTDPAAQFRQFREEGWNPSWRPI